MTTSAPTPSEAQQLPPDPIRLLLCDDAAQLRALYKIVFDAEADIVVVGEAGDGNEGVRAARHLHPDVVLLDIAMPVMDGLEAIPGIREAAPDARIVMCTAMVDDRIRRRALELGAHGFIEKGHDPRELVEAVRGAVADRRGVIA
jgi:DNA-binding NarL/FixJ family response regulator